VWVGLIWPEWPDEVWGLVFGVEREILGGCFNLLFGSSLKLTGCWRLDFRRCCSLKVLCSSYCNFLFWSKIKKIKIKILNKPTKIQINSLSFQKQNLSKPIKNHFST